MTRRRVELALWIAALVLAVLAGVRMRAVAMAIARTPATALSWETYGAPPSVHALNSAIVVAASESLVTRDPFRLERRPSGVPYSAATEGVPPPAPRPPRPTLAVAGIVGGPPWEAIITGIPGRTEAAVVRRGDTLGALHVRSITKDTVRITGLDTTWVLTVREAWP